jgi:hypothetical protein
MSKKANLLWGADPEFFAGYDKEGVLYAMPPVVFRRNFGAEVKENGSHPIFMEVEGVKIHEDGAAFEMSLPPSSSWMDLFDRINHARKVFAETFLSRYEVNPELLALPSIQWEVGRWIGEGGDFKFATRFGCDPDLDAFSHMLKTPRRSKDFDASLHPWRYAGGHIHISGVKEIQESPLIAIRSLALTAGLAATAYSDVADLERERVFRYGLPGKFRVQKYNGKFNDIEFSESGVEYRTPSVRWTSSRDIASKVFGWAEVGIQSLLIGGLYDNLSEELVRAGIESIIKVDQEQALEVLKTVESLV